MRESVSHPEEDPNAPEREQRACSSTDEGPARQNFFQSDKHRQNRDPEEIHHPENEEQRHQRPAATDAKQTMLQSHDECAAPALPPMARDKFERRAAMSQAAAFERRELKNASQQEENAAEESARRRAWVPVAEVEAAYDGRSWVTEPETP